MDIGYIVSKRFEPLSENHEAEYEIFQAIVDEALSELQGKTGIIIDIRNNAGGQSSFAFYLAGRFFSSTPSTPLIRQRVKIKTGDTKSSLSDWITQPFDGYTDTRVEDGTIGSTYPDENNITVSGDFQFTRKIALLTSKGTKSAAEYFIVAMKSQSHVKSFGTTTFGIFAGSEWFTLKNGKGKWVYKISVHDVEIRHNGVFQSFEGIGILPDNIIIPSTEKVVAGKEIHLHAAREYIKSSV